MSALLALKYLAAMGGGAPKTMIEDVFSAYTYTGNGSTQTITNGIDLAGKGGMVWIKSRSNARSSQISDTAQGTGYYLASNTTNPAYNDANRVSAFNSNGFSTGADTTNGDWGLSGYTYVAWTFRKAPKFFDVVTFSHGGSGAVTFNHSLGQAPGMVIIKNTASIDNWWVYHRSIPTQYIVLNQTAAAQSSNIFTATATDFTVANGVLLSGTHVAYLFAHDTSADGLIQCGSYTVDAGGNPFSVNLGCEPQYVLIKSSSGTGGWYIFDNLRGIATGGDDSYLLANTSGAEVSGTVDAVDLTATGFKAGANATVNAPSTTYIYLAIRRGPMRFPTSGTQVYNAIARTGTGAAATVTGVGFAPDFVQISGRESFSGKNWIQFNRLCGGDRALSSDNTGAEFTNAAVLLSDSLSTSMDGVRIQTANPINSASYTYINHFFRRAPGVFDVVCYTGTGSAHTESHNLTVAPTLILVKNRNVARAWACNDPSALGTHFWVLNDAGYSFANSAYWNNTAPTATSFTVGSSINVNNSGDTYVAYLFATLAGVSKVGSYTGNGTNQTINCGFAAGARFIFIKRVDDAGSVYATFIWDSARGIVAGNDPHLSLNTTVAEVTTDDSIDPQATGFIVNEVAATSINTSGGTYIYLAFA